MRNAFLAILLFSSFAIVAARPVAAEEGCPADQRRPLTASEKQFWATAKRAYDLLPGPPDRNWQVQSDADVPKEPEYFCKLNAAAYNDWFSITLVRTFARQADRDELARAAASGKPPADLYLLYEISLNDVAALAWGCAEGDPVEKTQVSGAPALRCRRHGSLDVPYTDVMLGKQEAKHDARIVEVRVAVGGDAARVAGLLGKANWAALRGLISPPQVKAK